LIQRTSVQQGPARPRTVGGYQVYHDGTPIASLSGTTAESGGPSSNTLHHVRILPGSYPLATHAGPHYCTINYQQSTDLGVSPKPGILLMDTGGRSEILIHPGKDEFLSSIGCINLCTRLPDESEPISYRGSRARVIALIEDMKAYLAGFPTHNDRPIPNAQAVIEEGP
jgi:hypothetical protein